MAKHAGITDVRATLLPEQKVEALRGLQASGHRVLVIGDGVNDARAMAAAGASVAGLARQARRVVACNLAIAVSFITVLVLWDLFGQLPLPLGVAGHEGSTIIVALTACAC